MDDNTVRSIGTYPESVCESLQEAIELQQNLYELSSDWNYYERDQHGYLQNNIRYALFGVDDKSDESDIDLDKFAKETMIIDLVYQKILEASRSKKSLYVAVIFNVLCGIKKDEKFVIPVPIFMVKRCIEKEKRSNITREKKIGKTGLYSCCVHYIDSEGRIYKNWTDYVATNTLPKCLMVLPMGGFYQADPYVSNTAEKTHIWVEIGPSPAATQITPYLDIASTTLGLGALGIGVAALATTLAAPVVIAGTACGAVSGAYTTIRSGQQLIDRHEHQQSINVTDRTARSAWLGVAGGVAGGLASGSTFLLSKAARAGVSLGVVTRSTYNAIAIGNIVINGAGIGNGVYSILKNYNEKKEISALEVTQMVAHILFFGNAVMNFQTAKTVISNSQQQVLQDYENSLRSNRHKKAFKRIRRNTQAANADSITGDSEIIRGIRSIQNKDDFFAGIVRNRKIFSRSKAEVTFKDGYAMINDNMKFDPVELSQQPKNVRINTVRAAQPLNEPRSIPSMSVPTRMPESSYNEQVTSTRELIESLPNLGQISKVICAAQYVGRLVIELQEFKKNHREGIIAGLANIALRIVKENRRNVTRAMDELMYYLWKVYVQPAVDEQLQFLDLDITKMAEIPAVAEIVYTVTQGVINQIYDGIEYFLEEIIEAFSNKSSTPQLDTCSICSGFALSDSD